MTIRTTPLLRGPAELIGAAARMMQAGRSAKAVAALELASDLVHNHPGLLTLLGEALLEENALPAAEAALLRAKALDGKAVPPRVTLCRLLLRQCRFAEALAEAEAAAPLAPDHADLRVNHAQALTGLGRRAEAAAMLREVLAGHPRHVTAHLGLALTHFLAGEWEQGFAEYSWRHALPEMRQPGRPTDRRWTGEDVRGKAILLFGEQGAGDTIQFLYAARLLAERGAQVALALPPALLPVAPAGQGVTPFSGPTRAKFDFVSSLIDAAILLGPDPEAVRGRMPSVRVPARPILPQPPAGTRIRIGICWAGSPAHANDAARSCPLQRFLPLLAHAGVELVSLQAGERAADIREAGAEALVLDLSSRLNDYGDTAAAMAGLDLVISVDTSVAHLAGAMAKPVWTLLPALPDWRWTAEGEAAPWYPTMRLFRQGATGDWDGVFARVEAELSRLLASRAAPEVPAVLSAEAARLHGEAMARLEADDLEAGVAVCARALRLVSDPANTWNNLGVALRRLRHFTAAEVAFRRSLAIAATPGSWGNLANTLTDQGRVAEADVIQRRLLETEKPSAAAWHNWGITLRHLGESQKALGAFSAALELEPDHVHARWDRSHLTMELGQWKQGWREYEIRWSLAEAGALPHYAPVWQGENLSGKTVVVLPEQGFGDTIFAVRYLSVLKRLGARVMLQCQPELFRLLSRCPWVDVLVPKYVPPSERVDYQVACMSLPHFAQACGVDDPVGGKAYLAADPALAAFTGAAIPRGPVNIGIIWTGSLTFKGNAFRRAGLEDFLPLAADPRIRLYALQKGPAEADLESLHAGTLVRPLGPLLTDFDATASVLGHLDGVIMTDSSTAHLAGALGRPVWVVLGERAYWLWGRDERRTRWYDSLTLVRRGKTQSWGQAIGAAKDDLLARLGTV